MKRLLATGGAKARVKQQRGVALPPRNKAWRQPRLTDDREHPVEVQQKEQQ